MLPQAEERVWLHSARGSCAPSLPAAALGTQGEPGLMCARSAIPPLVLDGNLLSGHFRVIFAVGGVCFDRWLCFSFLGIRDKQGHLGSIK